VANNSFATAKMILKNLIRNPDIDPFENVLNAVLKVSITVAEI
jgi:hypothetical protein